MGSNQIIDEKNSDLSSLLINQRRLDTQDSRKLKYKQVKGKEDFTNQFYSISN